MADKPISGLPALPGNLDLNALLAVVQGGVTYHADANALLALMFSNIKVVENAGYGYSVRFPGVQWQICVLPRVNITPGGSLAAGENLNWQWEYPQQFADTPAVIPALYNPHGATRYNRDVTYNGQGGSNCTLQVSDNRSSGDPLGVHVSAVAVGFYE